MSITFVGSFASEPIAISKDDIAFCFENSKFSRVKINFKRLVAQMDNIEVYTASNAYMPILRTWKAIGVSSGGMILPGASFDTSQISDAGIIIRQKAYGFRPALDIVVTGTPEPAWQQFTSRRPSAAEQQTTWDFSIVPDMDEPFMTLNPGECLFVKMHCGSNTNTLTTGGMFFIQGVWEEDDSADAGYTISGQVTLSSSPVAGAKVILLTDLDADMSDPKVKVKTTDGSGNWSETLASDVKASAFVQHENSGTMYTDEGKPFLDKP